MPYLLLAVRFGGNLAKMVPLVGDMAKELTLLGERAGQAAIKAAEEAPNIWYDEHLRNKALDMCVGVKNYLETVEGVLTSAEKKTGNYVTDVLPANRAPGRSAKFVGKPDLRALQGMKLWLFLQPYPCSSAAIHAPDFALQ